MWCTKFEVKYKVSIYGGRLTLYPRYSTVTEYRCNAGLNPGDAFFCFTITIRRPILHILNIPSINTIYMKPYQNSVKKEWPLIELQTI